MKSSSLNCLLLLTIIMIPWISSPFPLFADMQHRKQLSIRKKLIALELESGGRMGVFALNTENNKRLEYHAQERFPLCSTNKIMGVAAILKKSMTVPNLLQQKITYKKHDLVAYSPRTEKHLADGMTIADLCGAAISFSDNTAINLLMEKLGGLAAVNAFARSIGDPAFRLDRWEPKLNTAIPGDLRDTTTPAAMGKDLQRLVLGQALALPQRKHLQTWLQGNTTGDHRIRAGVPKGWVVGDKTGTGDYGTTNDIAVIWPPDAAPIVITIYFTQPKKAAVPCDDLVVSVTRVVMEAMV